ncbi:MAG TPA: hypothetical protein VKV15_09530 [Bryobacteraceae bacterium]|nr:hypothetical protein [Bryobacteraceae bacterium]
MKKTLFLGSLVILAGLTLLFKTARPMQAPSTSSAPRLCLLLTLGENAQAVEKWDGSAHIDGGRIVSIEGRHFSEGDHVLPPAAWRCETRKDAVAPYADVHYTEIRPGSKPPILYHPVGVYLTIEPSAGARLAIKTAQGKFDIRLDELNDSAARFLNGRVTVQRVPAPDRLTPDEYQDDEPSIAALPNGNVVAAWVGYRDRADRILLRTRAGNVWSPPEEVTPKPGDLWRSSIVSMPDGLWAFWSERENQRWHIWGRRKQNGRWQAPVEVSGDGSNTFHRAAASVDGDVFVVWQSYRNGQSDIYLRTFHQGKWSHEFRVSESPANDWEPAVAAGRGGTAYVAWDSYDRGNYDIFFRAFRDGKLEPIQAVTNSPRFQAHVSVAVDAQNRPWLAWNESGVNWAKDQGFLIPTPLASPIHQQRWLRVAMFDGARWKEASAPRAVFPADMRENSEHPQIAFDGGGALTMIFRHWTRRNARTIGSPIMWENFLTRYDGRSWSSPVPLPDSAGSIEKHAALTRDPQGAVWAAWMTDNRPFATMIPAKADIYCARLGGTAPAKLDTASLAPFEEVPVEAIPVHANEPENVRNMRAHRIAVGGRSYRIYRGDMHRHTDVSQDFKYDGSLIEAYRYAIDSAAFDYLAVTDHQNGYDQEFTWWQNQKLVDLFLVDSKFVPLYAYERSVPYPNGHRNVIWAERGTRTLPIPKAELEGREGAAKLYAYLKKSHGISMPHSSGTDQGTDWRDNDPEVEPLVEIYQGYRTSYEYEGAPRAATALNVTAQKSGWEPKGFIWNAWSKGYKLGVQSSSDHWSTHISYACLLAESFTREGLLDAIRKRHTYGATDNIFLDFRAQSGGKTYIMGDSFTSSGAPQFSVHVEGTGPILQIDLIQNRKFIYTTRPNTKEASFEFTDRGLEPGESWVYVRVLQQDGQLAWSSPMWVKQ